MVDATDKLAEKAAERKERRAAKRTKETVSHNNRGEALPVMTRTEQNRKLHELKARFLTTKRLEPFVSKLFDIAMDDEHDGQMAAMKMIADRILPTTSFSGEGNKSSAVQINISGLQVSSIEEKPVDSSTVSIQ